MITKIVTVLVSVYKSFCNTVCIYGHANKASAAFENELKLQWKVFLADHTVAMVTCDKEGL